MRFLFDEQVQAQPARLRALLARPAPHPLDPARSTVFAGLGTSLHAARIAAHWLGPKAQAVDAHEFALLGQSPAQLVVISHGGGRFARAALARGEGRTIAVIGEDAPALAAHETYRTCPREASETHSISYTSALLVLARLCGLDASHAPGIVERALQEPLDVRALAGKKRMLVAGFALDAIAAQETALKLKEACFVWAEGMSTEMALHGPQHALDNEMGAIVFEPGREDFGRTQDLLARCKDLPTLAIPSPIDCPDELRVFAQAVRAQRIASALAALTGGNPDTAGQKP